MATVETTEPTTVPPAVPEPTDTEPTEVVEYTEIEERPGPMGKAALALGVVIVALALAAIVIGALAFSRLHGENQQAQEGNPDTPYLFARNDSQIDNIGANDQSGLTGLPPLPAVELVTGSKNELTYDPATWSATLTGPASFNITASNEWVAQTISGTKRVALKILVDGASATNDQRQWVNTVNITGVSTLNLDVAAGTSRKVTVDLYNPTGAILSASSVQMTIQKIR